MNQKHKPFLKTKLLIAGRQPMVEALQQVQPVDKILIARNATGEVITQIKTLARAAGVPVQVVPPEKLNSLTNTNHQGVVAFRSAVRYQELQDVIDLLNSEGKVPLLLLLDGVTDVRNIGAIARSALCMGAQAMVLPHRGVAALQEDAVKASAGALESMMICRVPQLQDAIRTLKLNGISVLGSVMKGGQPLHALNLTEPSAVVMGAEDDGMQPEIAEACDQVFHIPMQGDFDSLNVSVATGMILYEAQRQRIIG